LRIAAVGFASPLHDEAWWRSSWKACLEELKAAGLRVAEPFIADPGRPLEPPPGARGIVAVVLTGGTSKQVARFLLKVEKPAVLVALKHHNSLPSALEARAYLRPWRWVRLVQAEPGWGAKVADHLRKAVEAREKLRGRVLAIGGASIDAQLEHLGPEKLSSLLGVEVVDVEASRLKEAMEAVCDAELKDSIEHLPPSIKLSGAIEAPVRLYLAAKRLIEEERATGVTFNCLRLLEVVGGTPCLAVSRLIDEGVLAVCEAEAPTLGAAAVVNRLLDAPFFIANVSTLEEGKLVLAHCTAPTSMGVGRLEALPHFESGLPLALDVELRLGEATLVSMDRGLGELTVAYGRVAASSLRKEGLCRTQALIELSQPRKLLEVAPGGHVVLAYGDLRGRLREAAEVLGLAFREV